MKLRGTEACIYALGGKCGVQGIWWLSVFGRLFASPSGSLLESFWKKSRFSHYCTLSVRCLYAVYGSNYQSQPTAALLGLRVGGRSRPRRFVTRYNTSFGDLQSILHQGVSPLSCARPCALQKRSKKLTTHKRCLWNCPVFSSLQKNASAWLLHILKKAYV